MPPSSFKIGNDLSSQLGQDEQQREHDDAISITASDDEYVVHDNNVDNPPADVYTPDDIAVLDSQFTAFRKSSTIPKEVTGSLLTEDMAECYKNSFHENLGGRAQFMELLDAVPRPKNIDLK